MKLKRILAYLLLASLVFVIPALAAERVVDLDAMTAEELAALREEIDQKLAELDGGGDISSGSDPGGLEIEEVREKDYWERINCPVLDDCLPDAESASAMAEVILARFQREGYFGGYTLQAIEYQSDPGIWVIHFWDNSEPDWITPEFAMAIRQDNAQVLKMWVNE